MPITENTAKHDVTPVAKPGEAHDTAAQEAQKKLAAEAAAATKAKAEAEAAAKAKAQAEAAAKAKAEAEAKAKGDAKPEAAKDGKSTGWLDMIESSASKAAGAIWDSAASVLPVLNLVHSDSAHKAVEKKEEGQLDLKKLVSDTCSGNSCKIDSNTETKGAWTGFDFINKDVQDDKSAIMVKKDYVSAKDMEAINNCFESVCKDKGAPAFDAKKFLQGDVHQSTDGTTAVRSGDTTAFKNPDGTLTTADIHGLISQKDKDGKLIFQINKEGHFIGALQNGNIADIDPKTMTMRILDKNGKPAIEVHNGKTFEIVGEFKNGKVEISEKEITPKTMIDLLREAREEAKASGKPQVRTWANGQFVVEPDGSVMGLQSDGTAILSVASDKYLVRNPDGSYLLYTEGESEPEKLNRSEVEKVLKNHHVEAAIIAAALLRMRRYEKCHKLEGDDHTSVSLINGVLQSTVAGTLQTTQSDNKVVSTDLSTGQKIEADVKARTVKVTDDHGQTTDVQGTTNGGFNVAGNGWKYNEGKVTTAHGDVIENGNIHFTNGTTYHNDGSTTFKDGSSFNADGSVTDRNGVRHNSAEAQAVAVKEAQAASMTAYAEGIAGSLRSLASSGHASLGDLAALESAYSSICSAVMALGAECDPAARVKLMMAQDDIGSSLEATLAALTQPGPQTLKAEETLNYNRNNADNVNNADNALVSLRYQSMNRGSLSPVAA